MMVPSLLECATNGDQKTPVNESVVDGLLSVAGAASFFRSADGQFHARVPLKSRHAVFPLKSTAFRAWLTESYRCDRGEVATDWAFRRALWAIEARASFDETTPAVHVRVGREGEDGGENSYLEVGDAAGRAIRLVLGNGR